MQLFSPTIPIQNCKIISQKRQNFSWLISLFSNNPDKGYTSKCPQFLYTIYYPNIRNQHESKELIIPDLQGLLWPLQSSTTFLKGGWSPEKSHYVYHNTFTCMFIKSIFSDVVRSKRNKDMPLNDLIVKNDKYRSNVLLKLRYMIYICQKKRH